METITKTFNIILEKEYEYLTSEESIIETIKLSDYQFLEDGTLF